MAAVQQRTRRLAWERSGKSFRVASWPRECSVSQMCSNSDASLLYLTVNSHLDISIAMCSNNSTSCLSLTHDKSRPFISALQICEVNRGRSRAVYQDHAGESHLDSVGRFS